MKVYNCVVPRPLSSSQIERLGSRLIKTPETAPEDLQLLQQLLEAYSEVLTAALERVRMNLGVPATSRIKNTGTILEKLHRYGGSWLKSLQDLAGMRIVRSFNRGEQDVLVARLVELFSDGARPPKVVDRRVDPVQGYRSVHVIVFPEGVPVEIQVRTAWQHEWAELFEKLADRIGRGIRYGEPPTKLHVPEELGGNAGAALLRVAEAQNRLRRTVVRQAMLIADLISAVEEVELQPPNAPDVIENRRRVDEALALLRASLEDV